VNGYKEILIGIGIKAAASVALFWSGLHLLYQLFAILVVVDIVTGVLASLVNGQKLSSDVSWKGGIRKVLKAISIGLAAYLDPYVGAPLGALVAGYWCADEGLSIIENYARAGLPLPRELQNVLRSFSHGTESESEVK